MATMKDVADFAGVSRATVSIVINGLQQERKIPEETCQRVYEAMQALNYQPNIMAKRLRGSVKSSPLIALYWPSDFRSNYLSRYIQGFQTFIQQDHFACELVVRTFQDGKLGDEIEDILHGNYSAVIFAATSPEDVALLENVKTHIPIVLVNRESNMYNTVSVDFEAMAEACILHFAAKDIREIAVLTVDDIHLSSSIRTKALIHCARQHNIILKPENIIAISASEIGMAASAATEYLSQRSFPKAIYCDNDYLAMGFLFACNRLGICVPQDIEVIAVGVMSPEFAEYTTPSISTNLIPIEEMATASFQIVANAIESNSRSLKHEIYQGRLFLRESSPALDTEYSI